MLDWEVAAEGAVLFEHVVYWTVKRMEGRDHDHECCCHDWDRMQLRCALKSYRMWRERWEPDCDLPDDIDVTYDCW